MFYIIGLGNPGTKYQYTKHNVAWIILDQIVDGEWSFNKYANAEMTIGNAGMYLKPQTFMNKSGEVVNFLLKSESDFDASGMVVIYDDIDLPFGTIRISFDRGDGGHNGLKSIIEHLGSKNFIRVRIGVSRQLDDGTLAKPNVLGNFSPEERMQISQTLAFRVEEILESLSTAGLSPTMNHFNTK